MKSKKLKQKLLTEFEGSTFSSHEDVEVWLAQALDKMQEAVIKEILKDVEAFDPNVLSQFGNAGSGLFKGNMIQYLKEKIAELE